MNHKQQMPATVHADNGITRFLITAGIDNSEKGIKEYFGCLLEGHPMLMGITMSFVLIPYKGDAL